MSAPRDRSRSPRRESSKKSTSGFKWKEKKPAAEDNVPRDSYRDRTRSPPRQTETRRYGGGADDNKRPAPRDTQPDSTIKDDKPNKPKAPKTKPAKVAASTEAMIIVNVNDRLGTKAAIPCLASDPVKAFKAMVAARIGRQPHEIMIKRQGERPFKDQLTLEDYGVSNGVQLDLELDTGD